VWCANAFSQTTLILQPNGATGKDAEVWNLDPNGNYGNSTFMRANAWTWSGNPGLERSLIQFDLSAIPVNATIVDAKLSCFAVDSPSTEFSFPSSGSNAAYLSRITSSWSESTVTWNNQPTITTANQVLLPMSTAAYQDYLNVDVTQLVSDMVTYSATSFGFMLFLQTESVYRRLGFCSSDAVNASNHPKLEVTYTVDVAVADNSFEKQFSIYPNPSSGNYFIENKNTVQDGYTLKIVDTNGKTVKEFNAISSPQFVFDLNDVSPGIYYARVQDGKNSFGKMIVKN
jgi:hypothetical protein